MRVIRNILFLFLLEAFLFLALKRCGKCEKNTFTRFKQICESYNKKRNLTKHTHKLTLIITKKTQDLFESIGKIVKAMSLLLSLCPRLVFILVLHHPLLASPNEILYATSHGFALVFIFPSCCFFPIFYPIFGLYSLANEYNPYTYSQACTNTI